MDLPYLMELYYIFYESCLVHLTYMDLYWGRASECFLTWVLHGTFLKVYSEPEIYINTGEEKVHIFQECNRIHLAIVKQ